MSRSRSPKKTSIRVNKYALGSILFENIRTNDRMDKQEVEKANKSLKKIDKSGRNAMLLSAAINQVQEDKNEEDFEIELVDGQYIKVPRPFQCGFPKCGKRFKTSKELQKHLEDHQSTQDQRNSSRAKQFLDLL